MRGALILGALCLVSVAQAEQAQVRASWVPPTVTISNTALTNLAGYVLSVGDAEHDVGLVTQAIVSVECGVPMMWTVRAYNANGKHGPESYGVQYVAPCPDWPPAAPGAPSLEVVEESGGTRVSLYQQHRPGSKAEHWIELAADQVDAKRYSKAKRNLKNAAGQKAALELMEASR